MESARDANSTGHVEGFDGDGYVALAIVYSVSFLCDWFAPTIIAVLGLKLALVCGSSAFALYTASFCFLKDELLYSASCLLGLGYSVFWVAQVTTIGSKS